MRGGGVGRRAARRVGRRGWPRGTAAALLAPGLLAGLLTGLAGGVAAQTRPGAAHGTAAASETVAADGSVAARAAANLPAARDFAPSVTAASKAAAAQGATPARVWTLAAALRRALGQSQRLKAAGAEAQAAKAGIGSARSGLWPRLSVGEGVTRGDDPVYVFGALLRQHEFGAANFNLPSLNRPGALTDWQSSAQASVSLWDGGKTRAAIRGAKAGYRAAGAARRQTREQVLAATVAAYYGLREAEANWRTARRAVRAAKQSQQDAQARYRAGMAVEADELSADVYANRARQARAEAAGALAMARARLNQRLGRPLAAPLALAAAAASNGTAPLPATLAAWQAAALRRRPDLARARAQTAVARAKEGEARAAWWPQASAFASVERDQAGFTGAGGSDWMAGVQVRWSVFGGGARRAAQAQARAGTAAAQAQASSLSRAAAVEVQAAWYRWQTARRVRALSRENARRAAAALAMLRRRYRAGLTTLRTVLDAETDWTRARAEEAQAEYGWQMSRAEALASLGELNFAHAAALAANAAGGMAAGGAADGPATSGPAAWTVER
jgi:outer membrane protein TolC